MRDKIEGILDIDKKTQDLVEKTEGEIEKERESLRLALTKMENESTENAKKIAQEKFDEIIAQAEAEANKRRSKNQEQLKEIDVLYEQNKEKLINKAFNQFILGKDE